jgi:spore maturation protein CgeB
MKVFLLGRRNSVNHWLEDAAEGFAAASHEVEIGYVRRPPIPRSVELALAPRIGERLARRIDRAAPDLILAIGALHVPRAMLEPIAALSVRPPLFGWVGDVFDEAAEGVAGLYDLIGYTDTALLARHPGEPMRTRAVFLPHAARPFSAPSITEPRRPRMVFIANPTPHRRAVVGAIREPVALFGPAWSVREGAHHEVNARRVAAAILPRLYAGHLAALNIRNEINVLGGLNQRNFDPCLAGAALVTDDQPDLALCFEPGREVAVWRDTDELNAVYERLLADPAEAAALAERGRRRVLAEHTYARRLETLRALM